ncbi:unnamed protein product, partial [Brassica napus]
LKKKKINRSDVVSSLNSLSPSHHRRFFSGLTISTRDEIPLSQSPQHLISRRLNASPSNLISRCLNASPSHLISSSSSLVNQRRDPNHLISSRSKSDQQAGWIHKHLTH